MGKDSGRRWLFAALGLFLLLLLGWILLAIQLTSALAGPLPFAPRLMSNLRVDYSPDEGGRSIAVISLSILEEAMQAMGLTEDEAAAAHENMELAMSLPVPTATALNFAGDAPFTATPTITNTPVPTETSTAIPTNTLRPTTRTPTATKTPAPTNPPATAAQPSAASPTSASVDTVDPSFQSITLSPPPPDNGGSCSIDVTVVVFDPAFSSGIANGDVKARIRINGGPAVNYEDLDFVSGGFVGGVPGADWIATYTEDVDLDGAYLGDTVLVEVKVADIANGNWVIVPAGTYTMGCDCP